MRPLLFLSFLIVWALGCDSTTQNEHADHQHDSSSQEQTEKKPSLSPHTSAMAMVGDAHIHIDYSSPRVRDRIIWGGLVALNEIWVTGAHNATWLDTNKDLMIDGQHLPAGKYALFTIPNREKWTVILNKNWDQHGKDDYSQTDDVMRFSVTPESLEQSQEELTYQVTKVSDSQGSVSFSWEKVKISFPFEVHQ